MFFWKLGKNFFKLVGSTVKNMERINITKECNQYSSLFKVLK